MVFIASHLNIYIAISNSGSLVPWRVRWVAPRNEVLQELSGRFEVPEQWIKESFARTNQTYDCYDDKQVLVALRDSVDWTFSVEAGYDEFSAEVTWPLLSPCLIQMRTVAGDLFRGSRCLGSTSVIRDSLLSILHDTNVYYSYRIISHIFANSPPWLPLRSSLSLSSSSLDSTPLRKSGDSTLDNSSFLTKKSAVNMFEFLKLHTDPFPTDPLAFDLDDEEERKEAQAIYSSLAKFLNDVGNPPCFCSNTSTSTNERLLSSVCSNNDLSFGLLSVSQYTCQRCHLQRQFQHLFLERALSELRRCKARPDITYFILPERRRPTTNLGRYLFPSIDLAGFIIQFAHKSIDIVMQSEVFWEFSFLLLEVLFLLFF